jgi:hypothetical protein
MTRKTKSTLKMICSRVGIANVELNEEARKLLELYEDPTVSSEEKAVVLAKIDEEIKKLEERVTTRKLKSAKDAGAESSAL